MPYPPEQMQKLYEKLPPELQTALFSEETSEVIGEACEQYGIGDERVSQVAKYVGDVLTGFILPSEFEDALRQNVDLPEVLIKPIATQINRFIFFPHKAALERLHARIGEEKRDVEIPTPRHSDRDDYIVEEPDKSAERNLTGPPESEGFGGERKGPDTYREEIE